MGIRGPLFHRSGALPTLRPVTAERSDPVRDFLRKPNPAVVATLASDGRPVTVATWCLLEDDGRILVNLAASRVRLGHLLRDPR